MRNRIPMFIAAAVAFAVSIVIPWLVIPTDIWHTAIYASVVLLAVSTSLIFITPILFGSRGNAGGIAAIGPSFILIVLMSVWSFWILIASVTVLPEQWVWAGNIVTVAIGVWGLLAINAVVSRANHDAKRHADSRIEWSCMCLLLQKRSADDGLKSTLKQLSDKIRFSASSMDNVAKTEESEIETIIYNTLPDEIGKPAGMSLADSLVSKIEELLLNRNQKLQIARSKF
ncbi:MAG: hypothetical protein ACI4NO_02890 [Oxalobacter sp.]